MSSYMLIALTQNFDAESLRLPWSGGFRTTLDWEHIAEPEVIETVPIFVLR